MRFKIEGADGETGHEVALTVEVPSVESAREYASRKGIVVSRITPERSAGADPGAGLRPLRVIDYASPIPPKSGAGPSDASGLGPIGKIGRVVALVGLGAVCAGDLAMRSPLGDELLVAGLLVMTVGVIIALFDRRSGAGREGGPPPAESSGEEREAAGRHDRGGG